MDKSSDTNDVRKEIITVDTARKLFGFVLSARGVEVEQPAGKFETNDMFKVLGEKSIQMTQDIWAKGKSPKIQEQLREFLETGRISSAIKSNESNGKKYTGSIQSLEGAVKGKVQQWSSKGRTDLVEEIKSSQAYSGLGTKKTTIDSRDLDDDAR